MPPETDEVNETVRGAFPDVVFALIETLSIGSNVMLREPELENDPDEGLPTYPEGAIKDHEYVCPEVNVSDKLEPDVVYCVPPTFTPHVCPLRPLSFHVYENVDLAY